MKKITVILFVFLLSIESFAALPPQYQNAKDFNVIIEFVKNNRQVIATLKSIDFENFVVHYGNDCKALFAREVTPKPAGMVGPADPLAFQSSTCSLP